MASTLSWLYFALVYFVLQWGHLRQEMPSFFAHHLTDVLCLPLVLGVVLAVHRQRLGAPSWRLPRWHGLSAVLIYSIYFELILPRLDGRATGDPLDGLSYLAGWFLFEWLINRRR